MAEDFVSAIFFVFWKSYSTCFCVLVFIFIACSFHIHELILALALILFRPKHCWLQEAGHWKMELKDFFFFNLRCITHVGLNFEILCWKSKQKSCQSSRSPAEKSAIIYMKVYCYSYNCLVIYWRQLPYSGKLLTEKWF